MTTDNPSEGMDYRASRKSWGGLPKGTEQRRPGFALKLALHKWAVATIGGGDEAVFYRQMSTEKRGRFSPKAVAPVIPLLIDHFPEECGAYFGGRIERANNLVANRLHKMYYGQTSSSKGRGEASREHPKNWSAADRSAAEARLAEVEWPW